jgi:zinc protease
VTDSSLAEFMRELRAIRDGPVDSAELARAKSYITLGLPSQFETSTQVAGHLGELLTFGLPLDYFSGYARRIRAVTSKDVQRVARAYIRPDSLSIVVVGDLAKVRAGIEALHLGSATVIPPP